MTTRRSGLVYGVLFAIWASLIAWQVVEHTRSRQAAQVNLIRRTKDISTTLGLLVRSQSFFGQVSRSRLESALKELVAPSELRPISVALVSSADELVASAGQPIDQQSIGEVESRGGAFWDDAARKVTLMDLVDLGTNRSSSFVVDPFRGPPPSRPGTNLLNTATNVPAVSNLPPVPQTSPAATNGNTSAARNPGANDGFPGGRRRNGRRGPGRGGDEVDRPFEKPDWMGVEDYKSIIEKKGVHAFILVMPTDSLIQEYHKDLWVRAVIASLATISVLGYGLAWRSLTKTSDLQIRLVRESSMNTHLREMNLAAAGLAHETRNPLNIVRGLAQMISKQPDASPEIRGKTREIIDETDRVAAQLNEFINYSRPREVRRVATNLNAVFAEVVRALNYDVEEKKIRLQVQAEPISIEADEQLLRQALFNLVLNATQAVAEYGEIRLRAGKANGGTAFIEISDDGPGVSAEHRAEIFKPYFTTQAKGTGLGLAVVQQIVLAHGWEIAYVPNEPSGAKFRISLIKLNARS